jgi:hypothetical protein
VSAAGLPDRAGRIAEVVVAVARQLLIDRGVSRLALLDDGSPEARLAAGWLEHGLGGAALVRVREPVAQLELLLQKAADPDGATRAGAEGIRFTARLLSDVALVNPANKTAILLSGDLPPEPLLPLADLYASEVRELAGDWSAPPPVRALAERAGGIEVLDRALRELFEARNPEALDALPGEIGHSVRAALARGRAARRSYHVVPKLGSRTLGVDLFQ